MKMRKLLKTLGITGLGLFIITFIILGLFPVDIQEKLSHITGYLTLIIAFIAFAFHLTNEKLSISRQIAIFGGCGFMIIAYCAYLLNSTAISSSAFSIICDCGTSCLLIATTMLFAEK